MNNEVTLLHHISKIEYLGRVIGQTYQDYLVGLENNLTFYNLDFGLICPVLFDLPSRGSNDFLDPVKQWMDHVLNMANENHKIKFIISAATLYEFYDQMNHFIEELQLRKPILLTNYFNKKIDNESGISTKEIIRDLAIFSEQGYHSKVLRPVNRLKNFLNNDVIYGVGDYFESLTSKESIVFNELTNEFLEQHMSKRLSEPKKRSYKDCQFHFRMDALNNALSIILARRNKPSPLFVTPTRLNLEQCINNDLNVGRFDRVPLFNLNLKLLKNSNYFSDPRQFLSEGFRLANDLKKELVKYQEIKDIPLYEREKLESFYKIYAAPLSSHKINENKLEDAMNEEITDVLSSKQKMEEIIEKAIDDVQAGALEIDRYSKRIDISYMKNIETLEDPIVKKLKRNLGLDKGS